MSLQAIAYISMIILLYHWIWNLLYCIRMEETLDWQYVSIQWDWEINPEKYGIVMLDDHTWQWAE